MADDGRCACRCAAANEDRVVSGCESDKVRATSPVTNRVAATADTSHGTPAALRWTIAAVAVAYAGYLALLITCDLNRVPALGFRADFGSGAMVVRSVAPDSIAARAGLEAGDRIVRANGQTVEGRTDWQRVHVHLGRALPLGLEVVRHGALNTVTLRVDRASATDPGLPPPGLVAFRLAQVVTLGFAIMVGLRRPSQPSALLGALLLASIATISLKLPMRLAEFWEQVPALPALLFWLPFATSVAVGPLLFAFFAVFPRRTLALSTIGVLLLPGLVAVAWYVRLGLVILAPAGAATRLPDWTGWVFVVNVSYLLGAIVVALTRSDPASTVTDRRRARVLMVGTTVGVAASVAVVARYLWDPWGDIFATRILTVLSLAFLAMPASFAYAILRHRLFDVSLIVRQGLRYALARRFVDAMIPALAGVLLFDILVNRDRAGRRPGAIAMVVVHGGRGSALGGADPARGMAQERRSPVLQGTLRCRTGCSAASRIRSATPRASTRSRRR